MARAKNQDETSEAVVLSDEEKVQAYIEANPQYQHSEIYMAEDGAFFPVGLKGTNAVINHCDLNKITYKTYTVR